MPGVASGDTTVTNAPAASSPPTFDSPTGPAPTSSTGRPSSFTKIGNSGISVQTLGSRLPALGVTHVQPALLRVRMLPPPPAGALVLPRLHCPCARTATDAGISAIVQRVVRHVLFSNVLPHIFARPVDERVHLDESVPFVPLDLVHRRACDRLLPPQAGHPGIETGERAAQRLHFADAAAELAVFD